MKRCYFLYKDNKYTSGSIFNEFLFVYSSHKPKRKLCHINCFKFLRIILKPNSNKKTGILYYSCNAWFLRHIIRWILCCVSFKSVVIMYWNKQTIINKMQCSSYVHYDPPPPYNIKGTVHIHSRMRVLPVRLTGLQSNKQKKRTLIWNYNSSF